MSVALAKLGLELNSDNFLRSSAKRVQLGQRLGPRQPEGGDISHMGAVTVPSSADEAQVIFGEWKAPKPYLRIVPQPR